MNAPISSSYPAKVSDRDRWILSHRPARNPVDANQPYAFLVEEERSASGEILPVATIFLTNRECPWHCAMCDLWRNTLTESVPAGAIPQQIDYALERLPQARHLKLYNSGSFFDPRAIPEEDFPAISDRAQRFERTIVECHPALIGDSCLRFRDRVGKPFEIAMGLETAHPEALVRLNKRMTLDLFASAAEFLRRNAIDLRVFILVQPPFMPTNEALEWACRSVDFAFDRGATAITLIPTRGGNGAMEQFSEMGIFTSPSLRTVEDAAEYGVRLNRGRVFADTWDMHAKTDTCPACITERIAKLYRQNLTQHIEPRVQCGACEVNP